MDSNCSLPLPEAFLKFLDDNGLDPSIYTAVDSIPRYIRLKPGCETHLPEIEAEIKCRLEKVAWMSGFYSIHSHISIADSKAYREGKIYGIDAASGAAVMALDVCAGDHILDLCAAPGAKLCMLLDLLGSSGSVTGVDIARHRLAACRTMLQKYLLGDHCRLFVADGTTFSLLPIRNHVESNSAGNKEDIYMEWKSRRTWKERKLNNKPRSSSSSHLPSDTAEPELVYYGRHSGVVGLRKEDISQAGCSGEAFELGYDKVLVDAECTHDGSFRHVKKFENWGWTSLERRVLDAKRTDTLNELQLQLLKNGFRLLRMGGSLVYSTCSLTVAQNEDIVEQFLSENSSAELQEIEAAKHWPCRSGGMSKTLRFNPSTSQTSGLFVAKFMKCSK